MFAHRAHLLHLVQAVGKGRKEGGGGGSWAGALPKFLYCL